MNFVTRVAVPIAIVVLHHLGFTIAKNILSVGTCGELQQAVNVAINSGDTDAVLTEEGISCDEWTTFEIKNNMFKLVSQEGGSIEEDHVYAFENVRFLVSSGVLRADVALSFATGADGAYQEVNGGVLNVAEGGSARFMSDISMTDVTILSVPDEGSDVSSDRWHGGCIHNKGTIRFEEYFMGSDCATVGGGENAPGNGGGIFNGETGVIVFKGPMKLTDCGTRDNEGNLGGAIYNEGKMTMFEKAGFWDNASAAGGAILNKGVIKFLKTSLATFRGNRTYDSGDGGGQVSNSGTLYFNGGVIFEDGYTEDDGGAILNTDTVIIKLSAVFESNVATINGGAISSPAYATFELPEDTVFEDNSVRVDWGNCANWYQRISEDSFDFVCLQE